MGIFLEGPKMIGKSRLLRQQLLSKDYRVGGFYVQRLLSGNDQVVGFQLCSAETLLPLTSSYQWSDEGCFLRRVNGQMVQDLSVFEKFGKLLLKQAVSESYDVILLDEFGGIELLIPGFYQLLVTLLKSSKKIVGVYKSAENYQKQFSGSQHTFAVVQQRLTLEKIMENSRRLLVNQDNQQVISQEIRHYLQEVDG